MFSHKSKYQTCEKIYIYVEMTNETLRNAQEPCGGCRILMEILHFRNVCFQVNGNNFPLNHGTLAHVISMNES